jgi:hypothetical protein
MTLSDNQFEFLKDFSSLIDFITNVKKLKITATYLYRSQEEQQRKYDEGLSKTLESNHLYSCAIDLNIFYGKKILTNIAKNDLTKEEWNLLEEIGQFWQNLNKINRWGGFWKSPYDPGHFERNVK